MAKQKKVTLTEEVFERLARLAAKSKRSIPNVIDVLSADEEETLNILIGSPFELEEPQPEGAR